MNKLNFKTWLLKEYYSGMIRKLVVPPKNTPVWMSPGTTVIDLLPTNTLGVNMQGMGRELMQAASQSFASTLNSLHQKAGGSPPPYWVGAGTTSQQNIKRSEPAMMYQVFLKQNETEGLNERQAKKFVFDKFIALPEIKDAVQKNEIDLNTAKIGLDKNAHLTDPQATAQGYNIWQVFVKKPSEQNVAGRVHMGEIDDIDNVDDAEGKQEQK